MIVDFWAPWCGPCRMVAPEIERVAEGAKGRYLVLKVNTDALTDIAEEFRIRSIPTLAVIFRGRELGRLPGARSAADIRAFADQTVAASEQRAS
jgi:thioredoxin